MHMRLITPEMIAAVLLMLSVFFTGKLRFMKYSLRLQGAVSGVLVVLSILGICI